MLSTKMAGWVLAGFKRKCRFDMAGYKIAEA